MAPVFEGIIKKLNIQAAPLFIINFIYMLSPEDICKSSDRRVSLDLMGDILHIGRFDPKRRVQKVL